MTIGKQPEGVGEHRHPGIFGVNLLYLICLTLFVTIGYYVQRVHIYNGLLITQFGLVLLPALLFILFTRKNLRYTLRLNRLKWSYLPILLGISITVLGFAISLSLLWVMVLDAFGELMPSPLPPIDTTWDYLKNILIIAGAAGLCEEVLFRGVILRGYERLGIKKAIIITGLLFGLMHVNIQNFLGPIVLGFVIAYVVYRTNSIFGGMVVHFLYNAISLTITYIGTILNNMAGGIADEFSTPSDFPTDMMTMAVIIWMVIGLASFAVMMLLLRMLKRRTQEQVKQQMLDNAVDKQRTSFLQYLPLVFAGVLAGLNLVLQIMIITGVMPIEPMV